MELIAVDSRTIEQSGADQASVTFTLTETNTPARATGAEGSDVLVDRISVSCSCSGSIGSDSYTGSGTADIVASTARVKIDGKDVICEGDSVRLTCNGMVTNSSSSATSPMTASVTLTVRPAGQTSCNANKV